MAKLLKIFDGMLKGPKAINDNFEAINAELSGNVIVTGPTSDGIKAQAGGEGVDVKWKKIKIGNYVRLEFFGQASVTMNEWGEGPIFSAEVLADVPSGHFILPRSGTSEGKTHYLNISGKNINLQNNSATTLSKAFIVISFAVTYSE